VAPRESVGALVILRGRPALRGLAAMMFLRHVAHAALPSTFVLYATYRYGWDAKAVGLALAGVGAGSLIVQGALVAPFVRTTGWRRPARSSPWASCCCRCGDCPGPHRKD